MDGDRKITVEVIDPSEFATLANPGVTSRQILWPGNSSGAKVTITRVTVAPGATQPRHSHAEAEQVWLVEQGRADLLLAEGKIRSVGVGEVIRTPANVIHGVHNKSTDAFVYLAITTPPADFRAAYNDSVAAKAR